MKKIILVASVLFVLLGAIVLYQYITFTDNKLHVVVCDVGQGDAIFIRTPNGSDILVDGGPGDSVLSCLSKHMPFWDKSIEVLIMTHPDADHITGLIDVIKRYSITHFYTSKVQTETAVYKQFLKTLQDYKIKQNYLWQGDKFTFKDGLKMETFWPTKEWEGLTTNSFSVAELLTYKNFKALLTGDLDTEQVSQASDWVGDIDFLKVPHHGSRFGLTVEIINILSPELAAISVGKNSYGHPTQFVLDLLKNQNIKTLRTDQDGEVEIISDGINFSTKN